MDFTNCKTIGECLTLYREKHNLTARELSKKVQITHVFMLAIEKDVIGLSLPMRQKVIKMLGLPLNSFDHIK
jgi:DNA-binding XRE family transcriptional regulator